MVDQRSGSIEVGVQLSYIESGSVTKRHIRLFPLFRQELKCLRLFLEQYKRVGSRFLSINSLKKVR